MIIFKNSSALIYSDTLCSECDIEACIWVKGTEKTGMQAKDCVCVICVSMYTIAKGNMWLTTSVRAVGLLCEQCDHEYVCECACEPEHVLACMRESVHDFSHSYEPHVMQDAV